MMCHELELENSISRAVCLREIQYCAVNGRSHEKRIGPSDVIKIPANFYSDRNRHSGRPSEIRIVLRNEESGEESEAMVSLSPENFVGFRRIIFGMDDDGNLVVRGIRSRNIVLGRFWGFGCLDRDYMGRPPEIILRSELI